MYDLDLYDYYDEDYDYYDEDYDFYEDYEDDDIDEAYLEGFVDCLEEFGLLDEDINLLLERNMENKAKKNKYMAKMATKVYPDIKGDKFRNKLSAGRIYNTDENNRVKDKLFRLNGKTLGSARQRLNYKEVNKGKGYIPNGLSKNRYDIYKSK